MASTKNSHIKSDGPLNLNKVRQSSSKSTYDRAVLYEILDASFIGHVSIVDNGQPISIPMMVARVDDHLYLHGLRTSRLIKNIVSGAPICISVAHMDGVVVARSGMHCSANYRSAVIHATAKAVSGPEKADLLYQITYGLIPGSEGDYREHLAKEIKATELIAVPLEQFACKVRTGGPNDDDADITLPYWAGVIPVKQVYGEPIPSDDLATSIEIPEYAKKFKK